jgi:hypothetical protein
MGWSTLQLLQQMQDSNIIRIGDPSHEAMLSLEIDNANGLCIISEHSPCLTIQVTSWFALKGPPYAGRKVS